jgi:hypothetical protein
VDFVLDGNEIRGLEQNPDTKSQKQPKRELTPAALYELFERHFQCVLDQSGKCPLLVFTRQMCDELNEFFNGEENENTGRRRRILPTGAAHEELE